jgi:hypothetical protein
VDSNDSACFTNHPTLIVTLGYGELLNHWQKVSAMVMMTAMVFPTTKTTIPQSIKSKWIQVKPSLA